jgi:hypothetical protein
MNIVVFELKIYIFKSTVHYNFIYVVRFWNIKTKSTKLVKIKVTFNLHKSINLCSIHKNKFIGHLTVNEILLHAPFAVNFIFYCCIFSALTYPYFCFVSLTRLVGHCIIYRESGFEHCSSHLSALSVKFLIIRLLDKKKNWREYMTFFYEENSTQT